MVYFEADLVVTTTIRAKKGRKGTDSSFSVSIPSGTAKTMTLKRGDRVILGLKILPSKPEEA